MIPKWVVERRLIICSKCKKESTCSGKFTVADIEPQCPLGLLANYQDEVAARAWPAGAEQISGCCDSPLNYLSQHYGV